MAKVLVVGGAGYVGSATCARLVDSGHDVWVLDDLSTGHRELVIGKRFSFGKAGDAALVSKLVLKEKFDCVMHFAAHSWVNESGDKSEVYLVNNVYQTRQLLEVLLDLGLRNFVFSSTSAIFGEDQPIHEGPPKIPSHPYGASMLQVEQMLQKFAQKRGLRAIVLRYSNAAGAELTGRVGEWHTTETHLIPRILTAISKGLAAEIVGPDDSTADGTRVLRDYIHVSDLAQAHQASMERLLCQEKTTGGVADVAGLYETYNLSSGSVFSVREIISACEEVVGKKLQVIESNRHFDDCSQRVVDTAPAKKILGFSPSFSDLQTIVASAWQWEKKRSLLMRRAIFLDRDGTLNEDPGYLRDPAQVRLLPTVGEALALLKRLGYLLIIVSNQSGVGRGLIHPEALPKIHRKLEELLTEWSVEIDYYSLCLHTPADECDCRKPKPKLILDAAEALKIDVSQSYMVGDKISDIEAGRAAGCKGSILVRTGDGITASSQLALGDVVFIGESLLQVAQWVLSQENAAL